MQLICLAVAGLGFWFLYDGLIAWPANNVRATVYFDLKKQYGEDTPELDKAWETTAQERGWKTKKPKKIYGPSDLRTQIIFAVAALAGAGFCVFHYFKSLPQTTCLEKGTLILPGGKMIDITKIRTISKSRWDSKGIADLTYETTGGNRVKFIIDDYKFIGGAEILAEIEKVFVPLEEAPLPPIDETPKAPPPAEY